jgi:hypothetical protein
MWARHATRNVAPASGARRAARRYQPSGSSQSCASRPACSRRAQARSSASAPARTSRHRSRRPFTLVAPAVASSSCSASGSVRAVVVISAACVTDSSPARNAASVSGSCSSPRAVSRVRVAAPTVSPVVSDTQCAALRCPPARHTFVSSTRRASNASIAAHTRLPCATTPNSSPASPPAMQEGSKSRAITSSDATALRTSANTLPSRARTPTGGSVREAASVYRTHVRCQEELGLSRRPPCSS